MIERLIHAQQTELWRTTRLGAKYLADALAEISRTGATGSLTVHFHEGKAGNLEFREKVTSISVTQRLDKKAG